MNGNEIGIQMTDKCLKQTQFFCPMQMIKITQQGNLATTATSIVWKFTHTHLHAKFVRNTEFMTCMGLMKATVLLKIWENPTIPCSSLSDNLTYWIDGQKHIWIFIYLNFTGPTDTWGT